MKPKVILVGVAAAVALTGIWFFALWSPQGGNLDKAKAERVASQTQADDLRVRLAKLKNLEANADVLERDRVKLAAAIPDTDLLDQFILKVNEQASAAGVAFVSVNPTEPVLAAPLAAAPAPAAAADGAPAAPAAAPAAPAAVPVGLQLQINGEYFAVMRFLELLRDGERLVTVEGLNLTKGEGNLTNASITGKMFVAPADPAGRVAPLAVPANQIASA